MQTATKAKAQAMDERVEACSRAKIRKKSTITMKIPASEAPIDTKTLLSDFVAIHKL